MLMLLMLLFSANTAQSACPLIYWQNHKTLLDTHQTSVSTGAAGDDASQVLAAATPANAAAHDASTNQAANATSTGSTDNASILADKPTVGPQQVKTPDELYEQANQLFSDGKYAEAIKCYEAVVGRNLHSATLYYNLGNAYFKINNYPSAILNYERAKLLDPDDEDIAFNLELARTFTVDVIEPLPQFFLHQWVRAVKHLFNTDIWAYIALVSFVVVLVFDAMFWFTNRYRIKRLSFGLGITFVLIFIMSLIFSIQLRNEIVKNTHAIVFEAAVAAKSSPDNSGKDLFVLHAGTKVQTLRTVGDWCEIKIADGNKGWLQKKSFKKI